MRHTRTAFAHATPYSPPLVLNTNSSAAHLHHTRQQQHLKSAPPENKDGRVATAAAA